MQLAQAKDTMLQPRNHAFVPLPDEDAHVYLGL